MTDKRRILAPTRYPWRFNSPRQSRHDISVRNFIPFNKLSPKIEGITLFNPWPLRRFDLIHAFNRIPLGTTPFIIGFESHLPRAFGLEHTAYYRWLCHILASPRCKAIIAISEYAKRHFLRQHKDQPWYDALAAKLQVRYPNMDIPEVADTFTPAASGPLRLCFVGSHFGRKGGPVAVRMAELAPEYGLNIEVDLISTLEVGAASWTDPLQPGFFAPYLEKLTTLPNLRHYNGLPNKQVLDILRQSHFSLLPTFSDTFGFSAIESMANFVPVIATRQGALPEFIRHKQNGLLLDLPVDDVGEWSGIQRQDRASDGYASFYRAEIERLAHAALTELKPYADDPAAYQQLRSNANTTARQMFSATDATLFWDTLYSKITA